MDGKAGLGTSIEPDVGVTARLLEELPGDQRRDHGVTDSRIETPQPLDLPLCQLQTWHFGIFGPYELRPIDNRCVGGMHVDPSPWRTVAVVTDRWQLSNRRTKRYA